MQAGLWRVGGNRRTGCCRAARSVGGVVHGRNTVVHTAAARGSSVSGGGAEPWYVRVYGARWQGQARRGRSRAATSHVTPKLPRHVVALSSPRQPCIVQRTRPPARANREPGAKPHTGGIRESSSHVCSGTVRRGLSNTMAPTSAAIHANHSVAALRCSWSSRRTPVTGGVWNETVPRHPYTPEGAGTTASVRYTLWCWVRVYAIRQNNQERSQAGVGSVTTNVCGGIGNNEPEGELANNGTVIAVRRRQVQSEWTGG